MLLRKPFGDTRLREEDEGKKIQYGQLRGLGCAG